VNEQKTHEFGHFKTHNGQKHVILVTAKPATTIPSVGSGLLKSAMAKNTLLWS
jgi:hypothetical protein